MLLHLPSSRRIGAPAKPRSLLALGLLPVLVGCAGGLRLPAGALEAPVAQTPVAPTAWQAPAPMERAAPAQALKSWWSGLDDPVLLALLDAAQAASPTVSAAAARIAQARAAVSLAQADTAPAAVFQAGAQRSATPLGSPATSAAALGVQASWELDLFGALRALGQAAQARLDSAQAGWHDARLAVAADVGAAYVRWRACEAQAEVAEADSRSRSETARLTEASARAGFRAPADAALARAAAAQGRLQAVEARSQCERLLKALVLLTEIEEPALRAMAAPRTGQLPQGLPPAVRTLPGDLLRQRPDLARVEREAMALAAEVATRRAEKLPRVSLTGQLGAQHVRLAGNDASGTVWSIGPLTVTWPLLDGGRRNALEVAAVSAWEDGQRQWRAALRSAVREVEDALVRLDAVERRRDDVARAMQDFQTVLAATEVRWRGGLASQFELEDARRNAFSAKSVEIEWRRERLDAAIALYRALGGGWDGLAATALSVASPPR